MKDIDSALVTWNNSSTIVVNPDSIPVTFEGGLFRSENEENITR